MTQTYEVVFETPAARSLSEITEHLLSHSECRYAEDPDFAALEVVETLIDKIEDRLSTMPLASPVSSLLAEIGITAYRELLVGPYRVWFKVHPNHQVSVYVIAHQRQDIERLLIDYCLLDF